MNYVFFGTPRFAEIVLNSLIAGGMPPLAIVANPDRPTGRKKIFTPPPVKLLAEKSGIAVLQPEKLDESFKLQVSDLRPQFAIVAAYGKIIPKSVIDLFPKGIVGVHPSLLPKHRGASPLQSSILAGDEKTGVSLYLLDEKMDNGPILDQKRVPLRHQTYEELEAELAALGGTLALQIVPKYLSGDLKPQAQNGAEATFTKKFTTEDGFVEESELLRAESGENLALAVLIDRKIRALNPEPGAWTLRQTQGKETRVKLLRAEIQNSRLRLLTIQPEGKKPQQIENRK